MKMNGIPIDISDVKVLSALNKITDYPPDITTEALFQIQKAIEMFIEYDLELKSDERGRATSRTEVGTTTQ
jgi:hypothetical protein